VNDLASALAFDDLVCFLDSALRLGWRPQQLRLGRKRRRRVHAALALTDPRSESTFETLLRLRFVRAGLVPEALQYEVVDAAGQVYARLDIAWPSIKLAIEADGRIHHDTVPALYRDRTRANALELQGWTILRFTWADLQRRPGWVVSQVRMAMITLRATA
jgi:very-short-patch-repair endonuclease